MKAFNFEITTSTPGNSWFDREEINVFANTIDEAREILKTVPNFFNEMEFNDETELDELQTKLYAEGKKYKIVLDQLITASLGLYHSTKENQYYVQIITAPKEEHLFFLVSKAKAREISEIGRVDIVPTEESFI